MAEIKINRTIHVIEKLPKDQGEVARYMGYTISADVLDSLSVQVIACLQRHADQIGKEILSMADDNSNNKKDVQFSHTKKTEHGKRLVYGKLKDDDIDPEDAEYVDDHEEKTFLQRDSSQTPCD